MIQQLFAELIKKEHKLYRQLLLRTVAMENQIPYVTASLNDSEMVFKDRILYMVNIRKLRRGILPGILVTLLLAGGNLVFNVSAGTDTVSVETEKSGIEKMQIQRKIMYRIMHRFLKW